MELKQAEQIAGLLNNRNQLVRQYTAEDIYAAEANYLFELSNEGEVIACAELKRVQWYQFEIDHLCVTKAVEGKGAAWGLLKRAEAEARKSRGRVLQCTIREDNTSSQKLFERNGFSCISQFYYPDSGNNLGVWQKVISPPRIRSSITNEGLL